MEQAGSMQELVKLSELPAREHIVYPHSSVVRRQRAFGYTEEDLRILAYSDGQERYGAAWIYGY